MTKLTSKQKEAYQKKLKKIEAELKNIQKQFRDIKKRSKKIVEEGIANRDAQKIEKLRKKLGV